jgi:hypothetical protein
LEPVSTRAVPKIVSDPPSSMLRADPKNFLGLIRAWVSTPPVPILPVVGMALLKPRATRVIESSRITT